MTTPLTTSFTRVTAEDLYPGFTPEEGPDPGPHWDPDKLAPGEEWDRLRHQWTRTRAYVALHSPKYIPIPGAYEMPSAAKEWADKIIEGGPVSPLVLYGVVGVGKTHGSCAVACYLSALWDHQSYTDAPGVLFTQASRLLGGLKNFGSGETEVLYRSATHAKVLVIDDLTRFRPTDYDMESLGQIIDDRQANGSPLIVTLNDVSPEDLESRVPMFLASRLRNGQMTALFGNDRREE